MMIPIYCAGAPIYGANNKLMSESCTVYVHDTTQLKGIPVFLDGVEVGTAVRFNKVTVAGLEFLRYEVNLSIEVDTTLLLTVANGYAGTISGAMWIHGLFPKKIQLVTGEVNQQ